MAHLAGAASLAQYRRELVKLYPEDVGSLLHSKKGVSSVSRLLFTLTAHLRSRSWYLLVQDSLIQSKRVRSLIRPPKIT